jgi:hypothetical protein
MPLRRMPTSATFTPSAPTANQTWLTFTRAMGGRVLIPVTGPANQTLGSFGSNFLIQGPPALPQLTGAGFNTGNPNAGPVTGSDNYELRDMVSMTKGKHNLSLGGEFALDKTMFLANLNNYGEITFSTSAPTSTGVALADFMTGQISSFEQDSPYTTHLSTWHTRRLRRTTTASRPVSRPISDSAGTSIRLPWMLITGRRRLFPASNPPFSSGRAGRRAVPRGQGHRSRHHQHAVRPHFASCRFCMGSVWGRQDLGSRRSGHLLRLLQRQ